MSANQEIHSLISRGHKSAVANNRASELPSDVLIRIFFLLQDMWERFESHIWIWKSPKMVIWDWFVVSMVCRRWRLIALECPSLWTEIRVQGITNSDKVHAFLERSGKAALDVDVKLYDEKVGIDAMLVKNMWRVRRLRYAANRVGLRRMMLCLAELREHAKAVEIIYITDPDGQRKKWLPQDFPEHIPNVQLESLALDSFTLPWSNSLYNGLLELKITGGIGSFATTPTISEFISVLKRCPNLQRLELQDFSPSLRNATISDLEEQKLCHTKLKRVALIRLSFRVCSMLLAFLPIGADTDLYLSSNQYNFYSPRHLAQNVLLGRKECEEINVELCNESLTILSGRTPNSTNHSPFPSTIISVSLGIYSDYNSIVCAIGVLLDDRFYYLVEEVTITMAFQLRDAQRDGRMDKVLWGSLLDGLPKFVRRITLKFTNRCFQDHDIGLPESLSENNGDGHARLPELEQLSVCYAHFDSEFVEERQKLLFEHMGKRGRHMTRTCKVSVVDQRYEDPDSVLYTEVETTRVFEPVYS